MTEDAKPKPVKLPYFHRTLSPEDQRLIGDITPKPIDSTSIGSHLQHYSDELKLSILYVYDSAVDEYTHVLEAFHS